MACSIIDSGRPWLLLWQGNWKWSAGAARLKTNGRPHHESLPRYGQMKINLIACTDADHLTGSQLRQAFLYSANAPKADRELPPAVARAFVKDMRAFLVEKSPIKRDEIAARQLWALKQHYRGKLRITDVYEMFVQDLPATGT
jgi:hypothetical protein